MLRDTVTPQSTMAAEPRGLDERAWAGFRELGLEGDETALLDVHEQVEILQCIGYAGALVPYADGECLARWFAHHAGFATGGKALAIAVMAPGTVEPDEQGRPGSIALHGRSIPWGRCASEVVFSFSLDSRHYAARVPVEGLAMGRGSNLAGEPNDPCTQSRLALPGLDVCEVGPLLAPLAVRRRGALARTAAMVGALARVNELTRQYADDRKQFGKPLSRFPMIQSYISAMAAEQCAAEAMLDTAVEAANADPAASTPEIAAAKVRVAQAAHVVAGHAHQVHGAMGITQEYPLHLWTRRLWAWREEHGNETHWAAVLGEHMVALGAEGFWERVTRA